MFHWKAALLPDIDMQAQHQLSSLEIDLTRFHRRTVSSFYSNLVTRPTGRAVRLGVEQQLVELRRGVPCLSILDFSQVRVLDYSCADEIVAKLLLRFVAPDRPVDVYFLARGLQDHHLESVEAVLDRHQLLLVAEGVGGEPTLLGPCDETSRICWELLTHRRRARLAEVVATSGLTLESARGALDRFSSARVVVTLGDGAVCPVPELQNA